MYLIQNFGGQTIILENPSSSDYIANGHPQWPISAIPSDGYEPTMGNDVRECVRIIINQVFQ
jgi:hypothetical protein